MTKVAAQKRGRPREYDPDVALAGARDVFWRAGFAGTSMDDLAAGMAMNRPSVYAAFGDKRALYRAAVTDYAETSRTWLASALTSPRSLRDGLRAVYRDARDFYLVGRDGPRGCFLVGTAVTEAGVDDGVRAIVEATLADFTTTFTERFERAERMGELSPRSPDALAHIATAALNNLAVRARTGAPIDALDALIEATIDVICGRSD